MTVDDIKVLQHPGVLFEVDGYEFVSKGVTRKGVNVIRLDSGATDQIERDIVVESIENGDVSLLDTHGESEVAVPEGDLITVLRFFADDPALDGCRPENSDVASAMLAVENQMPEEAYWFRYRDDE